ncbi:MAG: hypothetical protein HQ503_10440, partial [Rhodospirillales bacterium]|nr:hypothetical protein [Rhodospirillales bacterium]
MKKRIQRKLQKINKHRNIHLWGAPGVRHYLVGAPKPTIEFASTSFGQSEELVQRIVRNYHRVITDFPVDYYFWDEISDLKQELDDKNIGGVQSLLEHMFKNEIVHHFGHHEGHY